MLVEGPSVWCLCLVFKWHEELDGWGGREAGEGERNLQSQRHRNLAGRVQVEGEEEGAKGAIKDVLP